MLALRLKNLWLGVGILLVIAVFVLSLLPSPKMPMPPSLQDKTGHIIAYFVLMFWFSGLWPRAAQWRLAVVFVLMGVGLEFVQGFIPSRFSDTLDMLANTLGVVVAWALVRLGADRWMQVIERLFFGATSQTDG
ncbi:MAG: VanZ family protein [Gammaproteobacteria bacterium]